ncbi:hypothetical protein Pla52n_60020 [Stieleria varia]|uniref:Uncharacterized protein n=1 Tax=Stieleria varia TaxID=2528005 RepID=A0A5C6A0I9_9BACT|nr:hypothetical protein Pla52n_60020 [Stieleria varia]
MVLRCVCEPMALVTGLDGFRQQLGLRLARIIHATHYSLRNTFARNGLHGLARKQSAHFSRHAIASRLAWLCCQTLFGVIRPEPLAVSHGFYALKWMLGFV